ncbi:LOW QUALITY PROTEIN: glutaredoxin domain-containing cysteine-rich protein 2 [Leucoraja erinacea]|uniref:LOW QUALITY PROTEIN: glutaredoxin domain-containing cysteine-rich protein 2 n=1 Tax=Leucoraja erinaceus TaxID=7782 RepID=UPI002456DFCA|nr:LOW QUALITY PROTEIN: glutaredoxin domain-containing cysteine-rich protein 2 [Leucoraja erinacea]
MEELSSKLRRRFEPKPRKVRFRISSAFSGRVLRQVYEDGSESEELEEEGGRGVKSALSEGFRTRRAAVQERWHPPPPSSPLVTQRINVVRDGDRYGLISGPALLNSLAAARSSPSSVLNFGKIIIYTSNLRIIKKPLSQQEAMSKLLHSQQSAEDEAHLSSKGTGEGNHTKQPVTAEVLCTILFIYVDAPCVMFACCVLHVALGQRPEGTDPPCVLLQVSDPVPICPHCDGTGCVPCSLCHGSKLSMFANRFKESFRALRCPGCDENGAQPW